MMKHYVKIRTTSRYHLSSFLALKRFQAAGIPTVVWLSPILPFINDSEENLLGVLDYCRQAGVKGIICFGFGVTMREENRAYFYQQLDRDFPGMKEKYQQAFGDRYVCDSPNQQKLMAIFVHSAKPIKSFIDQKKSLPISIVLKTSS